MSLKTNSSCAFPSFKEQVSLRLFHFKTYPLLVQTGDIQLLVTAEKWLMLSPSFSMLSSCSSSTLPQKLTSYRRNASTEVSTIFVSYCRADQKLYALLYDFGFKTKNLLKVTIDFYHM